MAKFCTKCGKPLAPGQICDCRGAQMAQPAGFHDLEPYRQLQQDTDGTATQPEKHEGISIRLPAIRIPTFDTSSPRNFWASMLNNMGIGDPETNKEACYETGMKIVPDNLRANDGEIPIRQYQFARMRTRASFMSARGRLQITNKRLVFRAPGRSLTGRTILQNEFDINEIHGMSLQTGYRFSFFNLLVHGSLIVALMGVMMTWIMSAESMLLVGFMAFLFLLLGVAAFFFLPKLFPLKWYLNGESAMMFLIMATSMEKWGFLILALLPLILLLISVTLHCFLPDMTFNVESSTGTPAIIIARERGGGIFGMFGLAGQSATGYREVMPDKDTTRAIREINAIISDLQTMGDLAIDKWKEE